ncbi:MAG: ChaB family protein [Planctomycetaceae bacterium]|nr:ChaB family protein [Planctomycetaceae bacterium]
MPYSKNKDLPERVKDNLPKHAQDIYREAYNNATEQYKEPRKRRGSESQEQAAHKVAWNAVKKKYKKGDDEKWHPK